MRLRACVCVCARACMVVSSHGCVSAMVVCLVMVVCLPWLCGLAVV